jgi:hypothetical protein
MLKSSRVLQVMMRTPLHCSQVRWPSGLRRQTKDLVRKGVGSNPTLIIVLSVFLIPFFHFPDFICYDD